MSTRDVARLAIDSDCQRRPESVIVVRPYRWIQVSVRSPVQGCDLGPRDPFETLTIHALLPVGNTPNQGQTFASNKSYHDTSKHCKGGSHQHSLDLGNEMAEVPDHSPRNRFGEEDPRFRAQPQSPPWAENGEMQELRRMVLEGKRALPKPNRIRLIGASSEEQLRELWGNCYLHRIEHPVSMDLYSLKPIRRAIVTHWRRFWIAMNVDLYRFKAQEEGYLDLSAEIIQAWDHLLMLRDAHDM